MSKKNIISLALSIAKILEDYTETEIQSAVALLDTYGKGADLLKYLSGKDNLSPIRHAPKKINHDTNKIALSYSVRNIKNKDPEKFKTLSKLDLMLRNNEVLSSNEEFRRFGEAITKDFKIRKTRKDTISSLMNHLVKLPHDELISIVTNAIASNDVKESNDDYQLLANFIMKKEHNN
ncbi:TPA: hypothetical protein LVL54_001886 [Klebsiella michiganensis]|uniref:hypothetical protein n=1 Tax=Citrobacter freundii TaxID=546 RepID=UPI0015756CE3|nr:hypothetical protein [Citrobacter freundii]NTX97747.1 hypothetical protein [Citrobacter freundii]HAT7541102.1 hypothetical protein [Citrobacter freundii]HBM2967720.1 hypothetical protein [Klebsiella michiganensis]